MEGKRTLNSAVGECSAHRRCKCMAQPPCCPAPTTTTALLQESTTLLYLNTSCFPHCSVTYQTNQHNLTSLPLADIISTVDAPSPPLGKARKSALEHFPDPLVDSPRSSVSEASGNKREDEKKRFWSDFAVTALWISLLVSVLVVIGRVAILVMVTVTEVRREASVSPQAHEGELSLVKTPNHFVTGEVDGKVEQWGPGDWMRPLGSVEMMFAIGGWLRSLNTVQAIYVTSEQPLVRKVVRQALDLLVQRIPVLNTCIQRRGARCWFRRMTQNVVDLDIRNDDTADVLSDVRNTTYDLTTGPLWTVKLVKVPPGEENQRGVVHENQYLIAFGVLHVITDATTNMIICKEFVNILNDLLQNRPISSPFYSLSPPFAEPLVDATKSYLANYFMKRFFKVIILDFNKKTTFKGLNPLPKNYEVETRVKKHVFSEEVTRKLIQACKANGVTVHSCIVTVANVAYYDVARRRTSENVDKVQMYYSDAINLRRFYPKQEQEHMGCHVTMHEQKTVVTAEKMADFWGTAMAEKEKLHHDLTNKTCLKVIPIIKWASIIFPFNIYRNRKRTCNVTDSHYVTTNMGDVTNLVGTCDPEDPVHISDIYRTVNGEQAGHFFTLTCHTFRKRFYLSIDYSTNKMTDTQASTFFDDMVTKIDNLAEKGTVS
ncbi:Condensation domain [Trinorchestia longiramus]|nr:Condensation domain [Trinorchestia longiramus]